MPSLLWLVARSRIVDGRGYCQRSRYLNYHAGPNGYGLARKATKLPLMTGIGGHDGLAPIMQWCVEHDAEIVAHLQETGALGGVQQAPPSLPPALEPVIRAAVGGALDHYRKTVEARGFAYLSDTEDVQYVTREQACLIEGMIWAWCLEVLPETLQRCRILEAEHDDTYVIDCTCGLGDGVLTKEAHEARDCQGIGIMCKPDFVAETRQTQELEYHEFKTTGMDSITFRDKWEVMMQMFAATLDVERRLGRAVQFIYIHGLVKGKREGDYTPETKKRDGFIRQQSIFCYGYRKPANPPMEREEWAPSYDYVDESGANRRLGKAFKKTGIWELPDGLIPAGRTKAEVWVRWIDASHRRKALVLIGPLSRQGQMVQHFLEETKGEEARVQAGLWQLYELTEAITMTLGRTPDYWTEVWPHPDFQRLLDRLFPRSYECRRYGARNRCQFEGPCLEREGYLDPMGAGGLIERRPHHRDELEQAIGRGLLPPAEGAAEDVEQEF